MPNFYNLDDLVEYINTKVAPDIAEEILAVEAKRLKEIILRNIQAWYSYYTPTMYERTDLWYEALQIGGVIQEDGNKFTAWLYFDNNASEHPSLWGQEDGYVPMLMETGWHIRWKRPYRIPMLSDFEGTHYLTKAIEEYNRTNPYGLEATVIFNGWQIGG
jgi:hypothetical protein